MFLHLGQCQVQGLQHFCKTRVRPTGRDRASGSGGPTRRSHQRGHPDEPNSIPLSSPEDELVFQGGIEDVQSSKALNPRPRSDVSLCLYVCVCVCVYVSSLFLFFRYKPLCPVNPKPEALNPKSQTLNPKPEAPNPSSCCGGGVPDQGGSGVSGLLRFRSSPQATFSFVGFGLRIVPFW